MFEVAELGHKIKKTDYEAKEPELRTQLLLVQEALKEAPFPVLVLVSGVDGAGKGDVINQLNAWFDPRWLRAYAFGPQSDEERERPEYWRFWRALPPKGQIGLYVGSWYSRPIAERVNKVISEAELERALNRINAFEETLVDDGALIIKFWLHITQDEQLKRFQEREKTPFKQYKITAEDYRNREKWTAYEHAVNDMVERTSTDYAPWHLIEANDKNYARVKALRLFSETLAQTLGE